MPLTLDNYTDDQLRKIGLIAVTENVDLDELNSREAVSSSSGTFTATPDWNDGTIRYAQSGDIVVLYFGIEQGDPGATIATGIPTAIRPTVIQEGILVFEDNNVSGPTRITVTAAGTITYQGPNGGDDVLSGTATYLLN